MVVGVFDDVFVVGVDCVVVVFEYLYEDVVGEV